MQGSAVTIRLGEQLRFSWSDRSPGAFRAIESHIAVRARASGFKMADYADRVIAEIEEEGLGGDHYDATARMFAALYRCLTLRDSASGLPYAAFVGECDLTFSIATTAGHVSIALLGQDRRAVH